MLARAPFLHISFFSVDEAVSAMAAYQIIEGGLPYRDAIDHRGPLTYFFYAAIFGLFGKGSMFPIRLTYLFLHLLVVTGVFSLSHKWFRSEEKANLAGIIYACISSSYYFSDGLAAHTEWLLTTSLLGAWLIFFKWTESRNSLYLMLAAILIGLASTSKQVAVLEMGSLGIGILLFQKRLNLGRVAYFALITAIGFMIPWLVFLTYFGQKAGLEDFLFYSWTYNVSYYVPALFAGARFINSAKLLGGLAIINLILFLSGLLAFRRFPHLLQTLRNPSTHKFELLLWTTSLAAIGMSLSGGRAFTYYTIPLVLPISLLSAHLIYNWIHLELPISGKQQRSLWIGVASLMVISFGNRIYHHKHMYGQDPSVDEYIPVSQYIEEHTNPNDHIFVWGFAPEIYFLSKRDHSSRYTFCNPLTGHIPAGNVDVANTDYAIIPRSWTILKGELQTKPPTFIVDTQPAGFKGYKKFPMSQYPFWQNYMEDFYLDSTFSSLYPSDSIRLYRRFQD